MVSNQVLGARGVAGLLILSLAVSGCSHFRHHEAEAAARSESPAAVTDDCGVVRRYLPDVVVHVVEGSERNLKITHADDLLIAAALLDDLTDDG